MFRPLRAIEVDVFPRTNEKIRFPVTAIVNIVHKIFMDDSMKFRSILNTSG